MWWGLQGHVPKAWGTWRCGSISSSRSSPSVPCPFFSLSLSPRPRGGGARDLFVFWDSSFRRSPRGNDRGAPHGSARPSTWRTPSDCSTAYPSSASTSWRRADPCWPRASDMSSWFGAFANLVAVVGRGTFCAERIHVVWCFYAAIVSGAIALHLALTTSRSPTTICGVARHRAKPRWLRRIFSPVGWSRGGAGTGVSLPQQIPGDGLTSRRSALGLARGRPSCPPLLVVRVVRRSCRRRSRPRFVGHQESNQFVDRVAMGLQNGDRPLFGLTEHPGDLEVQGGLCLLRRTDDSTPSSRLRQERNPPEG